MPTSTISIEPKLADRLIWPMNGQTYYVYDLNGKTLLKAENDAWYELCPGQDHERCPRCGGVKILRLAGSEFRMKEVLRKRIRFEKSPMTFARKKELERLADIDEWAARTPDVAYLLAVVRSGSDRNVEPALMSLALRAIQMPLNVTQERYAVSLLLDRALSEAFETPQRSYLGNVGETATFTGRVTNVATLPPRYGERTPNVLVILETSDGAALKMNVRSPWGIVLTLGEEITVNAVVAAHVEHKHYGRQTELKSVQRVWS